MVRSFSGSAVPDDVVENLLRMAVRAPSAGNTDGRAFVVLRGPEEIARYWGSTTTDEWRRSSRRWAGLSRAPVVVVVLTKPSRYTERYSETDKVASGLSDEDSWPVPYWFFDAGASVMALLLGATDAGLGACFLGNFRGEDALLRALGAEPGWRFAGAVLLGSPGRDDAVSPSLARGRPRSEEAVRYGSLSP